MIRTIDYFKGRSVVDARGCWNWQGTINETGYGKLSVGGGRAVNGPVPKDMSVCHSCDNRRCCNPDHLWLGTHQENIRDMAQKGRGARFIGSDHPSAKLGDSDVAIIKTLLRLGVAGIRLAALFEVSMSNISSIKHERTWTHVQAVSS